MKCILLAGGTGTRLYPLTTYINKHLLPVAGIPMIYYPISFLISLGVLEILIVVNPKDEDAFKNLLGDGSNYGMKFHYIQQHGANGLAEPLILSEKYIDKNEKFLMMLGDNMFCVPNHEEVFKDFDIQNGATLVLTSVDNPSAFGVVEVDKNNNVISIEEKPKNPKSKFIASGLYSYDHKAIEIAKNITISNRGELEITDVNVEYLKQNNLNSIALDNKSTWFDCGTLEAIKQASDFVYENNLFELGLVEYHALSKGLLSLDNLEKRLSVLKPCKYKDYLSEKLNEYRYNN